MFFKVYEKQIVKTNKRLNLATNIISSPEHAMFTRFDVLSSPLPPYFLVLIYI